MDVGSVGFDCRLLCMDFFFSNVVWIVLFYFVLILVVFLIIFVVCWIIVLGVFKYY